MGGRVHGRGLLKFGRHTQAVWAKNLIHSEYSLGAGCGTSRRRAYPLGPVDSLLHGEGHGQQRSKAGLSKVWGPGQGAFLCKRDPAHWNGPMGTRSGLASCSGYQLFCDWMFSLFPWLSLPLSSFSSPVSLICNLRDFPKFVLYIADWIFLDRSILLITVI